MEAAVERGYAATKTEALRLGVLELNNKYKLLQDTEENEDTILAKQVLDKITSGKSKLRSEKELWEILRK